MEEKVLFSEVESFLIQKFVDGNFSIKKVLLSANVCEDLKFKKISNAVLDFFCEYLDDFVNLPEVKYISSTFLEMLLEDKQ